MVVHSYTLIKRTKKNQIERFYILEINDKYFLVGGPKTKVLVVLPLDWLC